MISYPTSPICGMQGDGELQPEYITRLGISVHTHQPAIGILTHKSAGHQMQLGYKKEAKSGGNSFRTG